MTIKYLRFYLSLYLSLIPMALVAGQEGGIDTTYRHHVMVLVDRTGGAQPAGGGDDSDIKGIVNQLTTLCFEANSAIEGSPLLVPGRDYLTIYPYGLKFKAKSFRNYFPSTDPIYTKMSKSYDASVFESQFRRGGYKYWHYDKSYGFTSVVMTEALSTFSTNSENFTRTFIILLTDNANNAAGAGTRVDPNVEYRGEIDQDWVLTEFKERNVNPVKDRRTAIQENYNLVPLTGAVKSQRRKFKGGRKKNASGEYYQGLYYRLMVYELMPSYQGVTLQGVYNYLNESIEPLKKLPDGGYSGSWPLTVAPGKPDFIAPISLKVNYLSSQGQMLREDNLSLTDRSSNFVSTYLSDLDGDVQVQLGLTALVDNEYYKGTVITPYRFPGFIDRFVWPREKEAKVFGGVSLPNELFRLAPGDSLAAAVKFYERVIFALLTVIAGLIGYIIFQRRKLRLPRQDEFSIK